MKELSYVFIGLSIGMLSPIENTLFALIPLSMGIFFYYFEDILDYFIRPRTP